MGRTCCLALPLLTALGARRARGRPCCLTDSARRKEGHAKGRQRSLVLAPVGRKVNVLICEKIVCLCVRIFVIARVEESAF